MNYFRNLINKCYSFYLLQNANDKIKIFNLENYKGWVKVVNVYDGDTFRACLYLHGKILKFTFRPTGYDAPEMKPRLDMPQRELHKKQAVEAKEYFEKLIGFEQKSTTCCMISSSSMIYVHCYKNDKYGRVLVEMFKDEHDKVSINKMMLDSGLVQPYDGGTKKISEF